MRPEVLAQQLDKISRDLRGVQYKLYSAPYPGWTLANASAQVAALAAGVREFREFQDITPSLLCPVTKKIFIDPVLAADGETYEREAIEAWLETHDVSPATQEALAHKQLIPNKLAIRLQQTLLILCPELRTSDQLYLSARLQQRLLRAVASGDGDTVSACIKIDERLLTQPLSLSETPQHLLLWAIDSGHVLVVETVIQALGARFDVLKEVSTGGMALFDRAVEHLHTEGARLIVQRLKWDQPAIQRTFTAAVTEDSPKKARVCLNLGANIEGEIEGERPLHRAIKRKQHAWVRWYVSRGADVCARDKEGFPALHQAMLQDDEEMARVLCALPEAEAAGAEPVTHGDVKAAQNAAGLTALHVAIEKQDRRWVEILLGLRVNVSACDRAGRSALHIAFDRNSDEIIRLLIAHDVDLEQAEPGSGDTGLLRAVRAGSFDLVQLMIERSHAPANINALNAAQETVLHICARGGNGKLNITLMEYLIENGADGHALNEAGQTPKEVAIVAGYRAFATAFVKATHQHDMNIQFSGERARLAQERQEMLERQRQMEERMEQLLRGAGAAGLFAHPPAPAASRDAPPAYQPTPASRTDRDGEDRDESADEKSVVSEKPTVSP